MHSLRDWGDGYRERHHVRCEPRQQDSPTGRSLGARWDVRFGAMTTQATQPPMPAGGYLRLVALGAVIGIPAALVAAGFLAFVHDLEHWLWDDLPDSLGHATPPWYLVVGLPVAGACIVLLARRLLPG